MEELENYIRDTWHGLEVLTQVVTDTAALFEAVVTVPSKDETILFRKCDNTVEVIDLSKSKMTEDMPLN